MNAVAQSGCKPLFIDVTDNLTLDWEDLGRKEKHLAALVVTHLFGVPNDVERIKSIYPDLIVIEDCAHAFGKDGSSGDFSTYSVGQGKLPSIGDGGILRVNNEIYVDSVSEIYNSLPDYSFSQRCKLFNKLWLKSILYKQTLYGSLTLPVKKKRNYVKGVSVVIPLKMCSGISAIFAAKKKTVESQIAKRKENARRITAHLPDGVNKVIIGENAFMLVLSCDSVEKVKHYFYEKGIEAETHFAFSFQWAREHGYILGDCPNAEILLNHLLMVPLYFHL